MSKKETVPVEPEQEEKAEQKKSSGKEFLHDLLFFLIIVALLFVLNSTVLINAKIPSGSMETTLMTGDRVIGNRLAYKHKDPERFDIVIFKYPDDESQYFVKRIIGMPGDTVQIKDGKVYINGSTTPLPDKFCYGHGRPVGDWGPYQVPAGHYFMMGDNRNDSLDSRYWYNTYLAKDKIVAKVVYIYWPFSHVKGIKYKDVKASIPKAAVPPATTVRASAVS
ncbi:MAG: signal peptidase I [Oscillospiraceae bacterium]|nr:signal peptidase I [Oscillospiraceae bacterium]